MSLAQPTLGLQPVRARTIDAGLKGLLSAYGLRLEDRLDDFTCELSVGQRQIVALLAVLQRGVDILALDEFTAHMDAASVSTSWQLLEKVKKEKDFAVVFADQSGTAGLKDAVILSL
jgi:energy-coupling factor transporter ATP-binding protein EcfA2